MSAIVIEVMLYVKMSFIREVMPHEAFLGFLAHPSLPFLN